MPVCDWIHFYTVDSKYPQDYEEVLIPTILEKQFPYGYSAANMGVVVLDIQAVSHIYEAVVEGKPVIERTIALAGPGFKENPHIKVRVGTPLEHITSESIKKDEELRFILNSPLAGATLSDLSLPIDRTFISIVALLKEKGIQSLAFMRPGFKKDSYSRTFLSFVSKKGCEVNLRGEKRPCISCTFCEEVCPVGIIPHRLYRYVEKDMEDELSNFRIFHCIECNLCSYVCPSKISVAKYIKEGKERLINDGIKPPLPDFELKGDNGDKNENQGNTEVSRK